MNESIKSQTEAVSTALRDLSYEVHAEWTKNGMHDDNLHRFHVQLLQIEAALSTTIVDASVSASTEMKIAMIPGRGEKKIQAIKAVREITKLGLKEAKELIDRTGNGGMVPLPMHDADGDEYTSAQRQEFVTAMNDAGFYVT